MSLSYPYHPYYHQTLCRVGTTFFEGNRFRKQPQEDDHCGRTNMVALHGGTGMVTLERENRWSYSQPCLANLLNAFRRARPAKPCTGTSSRCPILSATGSSF